MEVRYYDKELGIDGTCDELVTWSWRYSYDYSNKALLKIYEIAVKENHPKKALPLLEVRQRENSGLENRVPYESIVASVIYYGETPNYSATMPYGELEITSDKEYTIISIIGNDDNGSFTAINRVLTSEFMDIGNDANYLENLIGQTLSYGKEYTDAD